MSSKLVSQVIWKNSVKNNNYICTVCQTKFINDSKLTGLEQPISPVYERGVLLCKKCHHVIAKEIFN